MDAGRLELHEKWSRPGLMDEVDDLREGLEVLHELLQLLSEPPALIADEPRRESIWGNLWWAIGSVLWQARLPLDERLALVTEVGRLYRAVAEAGVSGSDALLWLTNHVFYTRCIDAEGENMTICSHAFEVFSELLEVQNTLVQSAALEALERIRDPRTRRRLEDARPFFQTQRIREQAAYVRGALRRPP